MLMSQPGIGVGSSFKLGEQRECPLPEKLGFFKPENGVSWCILMHYFKSPMREAAGFEVRGIIPGKIETLNA